LQVTCLALEDVVGGGGVTSINETAARAESLGLGGRGGLVGSVVLAQSDTEADGNGGDGDTGSSDLECSLGNHVLF
jgi:hypothetical protein